MMCSGMKARPEMEAAIMPDNSFQGAAGLAPLIFNTPLMVDPGKLSAFLEAAGSRILPEADFSRAFEALGSAEPWMTQARTERDLHISTELMGIDAAPVETAAGTRGVTIDGAVIHELNIFGSLTHRARLFASGGMSYDGLRSRFQAAISDPDIDGIMLQVDSPGGSVAGNFDLVDEMRQAAENSGKPIFAVSNEAAYSAAYSLASVADALFVTRTSGVGSVGVIAIHVDQSGFNKKMGVRVTPVFAGSRKNDFTPHAPLSSQAYKRLQAEINKIYDIFIQTVARNRGISEKSVRATEAGTYMGSDAVDIGFADGIATYAEAMQALAEKIHKGAFTMSIFSRKKSAESETPTAFEALTALGDQYTAEEMESAIAQAGFVSQEDAQADREAAVTEAVKVAEAGHETRQKEMISAAQAEAAASTRADIMAVIELCQVAGSDMNTLRGYVAEGITPDQARTRLQELGAARSSAETITSTVGAAAPKAENPLIADAKRRAEAAAQAQARR